jgi:hypothetical protein
MEAIVANSENYNSGNGKVVSVSLRAPDYEAVKAFKKQWGVSISEYFRTLHKRYYKEAIEGVQEQIAFSGIVAPGSKGPDLPGMEKLYIKKEQYDDFERIRAVLAANEGLQDISRQALMEIMLDSYREELARRYGSAPRQPEPTLTLATASEPEADDRWGNSSANDEVDDWENL